MVRQALIAACLVFASVLPCAAQVQMKHKFEEGGTYTTETSTQVEQKLTIAGQEIDTTGETTAVVKSTVGKRDAEGKIRAQEKIESLQVSAGVQGMNYRFDSNNPDAAGDSQLEVLRSLHKAMVKRETTIVYDKFDRAVAVESGEDPVAGLSDDVKNIVKNEIDPENVKNTTNELLDQITSDPVKPGDTWKRSRAANFGSGQTMTFETEYTYDGTVEKDGRTLDKVTSKVLSVKFSLANATIPFDIKNTDLKATESDGQLLFDREKGHAVETNSDAHITGTMTFSINGQDLPATLDLKMKTKTSVKQ
jgi:hypothetical protein